ncbi:MAG TPA: hypothetical protein VF533_14495 [Solirubrobacteraceae bacterium]
MPEVSFMCHCATSPDEGAGAAWTTAVAADDALADPAELRAVTTTRNVRPASAPTNPYEADVAPETDEQPAPALSQRRHWYVYLSFVGVQVPRLAIRVCPTTALPEIVGGDVFDGAVEAAEAGAAPVPMPTSRATQSARSKRERGTARRYTGGPHQANSRGKSPVLKGGARRQARTDPSSTSWRDP